MVEQASRPVRVPEVERLLSELDTPSVAYVADVARGSPPPLHPIERSGVERAVERRRREFAGGRACARAALVQLGVDPADAGVARGEDRAPIWPDGHRGSITHTEGWCLAVVTPASTGRSPGVDAELVGRVDDEIAREVFSPDERDALLAHLADPDVLTAAFCAKEALYKAQHPLTGRWVGFTDVTARVAGPRELVLEARAGTHLAHRLGHPVRARWTVVAPDEATGHDGEAADTDPDGRVEGRGRTIVLAAVVVDAGTDARRASGPDGPSPEPTAGPGPPR